jgi:hypothetical protein
VGILIAFDMYESEMAVKNTFFAAMRTEHD